jgi:RimJ/RimL family protein N-acetyltransferase
MSATPSTERIPTKSLHLVPQTREDARAFLVQLPADQRAQVSAAWLAQLDRSSAIDPWVHGFVLVAQDTGKVVGKCGFTGPPEADGAVEIAYVVEPEHQGKGYATEAAEALVHYAFKHGPARIIRAHTLPEPNASTRVLIKCGFHQTGEFNDPDDGLVWRWERKPGSA